MGKFRALLLLNLKAMLSSFRVGGRKKARQASGLGTLVMMAIIAVYFSGLYSFNFASQLAKVNMLPLLFLIISVMAVIMGVIFTIFGAQGVVFGGRDNDLMLALPISPFTLMLSRTLALYLENLIFGVFVMLPAGVAYLAFGGKGGVGFIPALLVCTVFLSLLPTLISLVCGYVLAWFSSKFTRKALLSTILYFAFFILLMAGVFQLNGLMINLAAYATGIQAGFSGWGLPFLLLERAVTQGDILALLGLCALCLLPFLAVVWLFARRYKHIVTGLTARGARSDYKLGQVSASGQRLALLKKEARRFIGTPIYLFNCGFGLVLMLVAAVAGVVMRPKLIEVLGMLSAVGVTLPLAPVLAAVLAFLVSTVELTSVTFSLEGKQFWILKEAPVSAGTLFLVKIGFQLLLVIPCLLVSTLCLGLVLSLPPLELLLVFLGCGFFALCNALVGIYINLCFPKLDAVNDAVVVKQSASVMISTFGSMIVVLATAGIYVLTAKVLGELGVLSLFAVLFAVVSLILVRLLSTSGLRRFAEL